MDSKVRFGSLSRPDCKTDYYSLEKADNEFENRGKKREGSV
jgi:hypothetical protein